MAYNFWSLSDPVDSDISLNQSKMTDVARDIMEGRSEEREQDNDK